MSKKQIKPPDETPGHTVGIGNHLSEEDLRFWIANIKIDSSNHSDDIKIRLEQLESHISQCSRCKSLVEVSSDFIVNERKKYRFRSKLRNGVVLGAFIVGIFLFPYNKWMKSDYDDLIAEYQNSQTKHSLFAYADSIAYGSLPETFRDDPGQDVLVRGILRSADRHWRENAFPKDLSIFENTGIPFSWTAYQENLVLVIKDNRNNIIQEHQISPGSPSLDIVLPDRSGLYYWDLRNNSELLLKRRFYLIRD